MKKVLEVTNLCKKYPKFSLNNVSFSVDQGTIMGFIGRNGAGKTTTIKSLLHFVHPDSGVINFFGKNFTECEAEIKERVGYAGGSNVYYQRKKIKDIVAVTKLFYSNWDDEEYRKYMKKFGLDENKKPIELSEGMKVKFQLVLALSHHANFLILDEPTSGLDPISREELLEIFLELKDEGVTIFFSTHITSDLDKCVSQITYIKQGEIIAFGDMKEFINKYRLVTFAESVTKKQEAAFLGVSRTAKNKQALILFDDQYLFQEEQLKMPNLETIMIHLEKEMAQ